MGIGDQLMATGMARDAAKRSKRIAFGDGERIIWDHHSEMIFRGNPNIAPPGLARADNLEWIRFYRGHRIYNTQAPNRWRWNMDFRASPGEVFLSREEKQFAALFLRGSIVIEPNVPFFKKCGVNKQWPIGRYHELSLRLRAAGYSIMQFTYGQHPLYQLPKAVPIRSPNFRHALAVLGRSLLYIGPEGGLHHGAAAMGIPAVVLFGGFIPPQITGYAAHTNLTGGADEACGSLIECKHCLDAMQAISVDEVYAAAMELLPK